MSNKIRSFFALFLFWFAYTGAQGQESIVTTGAIGSGNGGTLNYSIGQMVYTNTLGSTGTLTNGVQQAYEFSIGTSLKHVKGMPIECVVYSTPNTDVVVLKIERFQQNPLSYRLYDLQGKLLERRSVVSLETSINMGQRPSATYLLTVTQKDKIVQTIRISKK